jgi:DNA-binding protein Fis
MNQVNTNADLTKLEKEIAAVLAKMSSYDYTYDDLLGAFDRAVLEFTISTSRYNQSKTAHKLNISRNTLRNKLIAHFGNRYASAKEE